MILNCSTNSLAGSMVRNACRLLCAAGRRPNPVAVVELLRAAGVRPDQEMIADMIGSGLSTAMEEDVSPAADSRSLLHAGGGTFPEE